MTEPTDPTDLIRWHTTRAAVAPRLDSILFYLPGAHALMRSGDRLGLVCVAPADLAG